MLTSKVAKRYAQGLLNFTQETAQTDAVFGEMGDIVRTIEKSKELQNFLILRLLIVRKSKYSFRSFQELFSCYQKFTSVDH